MANVIIIAIAIGPALGAAMTDNGLKTDMGINPTKHYDVCSVGAGLSGVIFAERTASVLNGSALVIDVRDHIGGNCYDYVDSETGILMNKYGAHLFHTNSEKAYKYITGHKRAPKWQRWDHEVKGWVGDKLVPIPVNILTVNELFGLDIKDQAEMEEWLKGVQIPCPTAGCENAEQMAKSRVGEDLFNKIFRDYTFKQWAKMPRDLAAEVTARIPVRATHDPRYFADRYQVLPSKGYTAWFAALLKHPRIDVSLRTDYFKHEQALSRMCGKVIFTGPIDRFFAGHGLSKLEYRGIEFDVERRMNINGFGQTASVVNFPGPEVAITRTVEYKHFLRQKSPHTILVSERSKDAGPNDEPYYPVPNPANQALYAKYKALAEAQEAKSNVHFVGRLANYKYFNMDATIVNALDIFYKIFGLPNGFGGAESSGVSTVSDSL